MEEQEVGSGEGDGYGVTVPDAPPISESRSSKGHMVYSPEMKMSLVSECKGHNTNGSFQFRLTLSVGLLLLLDDIRKNTKRKRRVAEEFDND